MTAPPDITSEPPTDREPWYRARWLLVVRVIVSVLAVVGGLLALLVVLAVGHCSAFGGRCPREPAFQDDVFWTAAFASAVMVGVPVYLFRPSRRRLAIALVIAAVVGSLVGLAAIDATASF
jgi:VanZ family protein